MTTVRVRFLTDTPKVECGEVVHVYKAGTEHDFRADTAQHYIRRNKAVSAFKPARALKPEPAEPPKRRKKAEKVDEPTTGDVGDDNASVGVPDQPRGSEAPPEG